MEMCHFLRVIRVRWTSPNTETMSSLSQWIIVILIQVVFNSSGVFSGGDDGEHVHIKVHIPEVHQKHTHTRKVQKHVFHPKKVIKAPEYLDVDLDTMQPLNVMSYGVTGQTQDMQYPTFPIGIGSLPDIPTIGVDNTLEASIMKKPRINSMSHMISEDMFTRFHGMKKPSEFLGARPVAEMQRYTIPSDGDDGETYPDEYDAKSTESMVMDQRVAGSLYPDSLTVKPKWPTTYSNAYEPVAKPYMKWPSWLSTSTEDDYFATPERFPSSTTMHISKARPLSSSRPKYEHHTFESRPYSDARVMPKKKKSKTIKRKIFRQPGSRINY